MAKHDKSSKELASVAAEVLQQTSSSVGSKQLAGSVLAQTPDHKKPSAPRGKK